MQYRRPTTCPSSAQRGTSLIEILVVLVILVVGILSIVRLFPAGFIALRNAENATFADRLAEDALQALKKDNASLPDAVYMYSDNTDGAHPAWFLGFDPNIAPDDFRPYNPDAKGVNQYTVASQAATPYDDINKQRYVFNETITIPAGRVVNSKPYPPLHILNYGPIYLPGDVSKYATYLPVNSMPWTARTGDSRVVDTVAGRAIDNPTDILQPGQQAFLVDYNAGKIAVPTAAYVNSANAAIDSKYVLVVQTGTGSSAQTYTLNLSVPSNGATSPYDGNWFDPTNTYDPTPPTSLPAAPWTSVTLYRPFQYKGIYGTATAAFDTDPYEYAIYHGGAATDPGGVSPDAGMGILAFNPLASGQNGTQPLKARISYQVLDWHILHEDHDVPAGVSTIRLTLGHLKMIGDTQFDQSIYKGLIGDATHPADIMLLDLDTGDLTELNGSAGTTFVNEGSSGAGTQNVDTASSLNNNQYGISYLNGRVTFPSGSTARHLRFFYAGDADWAVAVSKAASVYNRINQVTTANPTGTPAAADYTTLTTPGPTPNNYVADATTQRVYFPACDAGKTVEFDGISYTDTNGKAQQLSEATATISTDNVSVSGLNLVYVNLTGSGQNSSGVVSNMDTTKAITFSAVRGISARATVIWHERNQWRTRSVDTLLTQSQ